MTSHTPSNDRFTGSTGPPQGGQRQSGGDIDHTVPLTIHFAYREDDKYCESVANNPPSRSHSPISQSGSGNNLSSGQYSNDGGSRYDDSCSHSFGGGKQEDRNQPVWNQEDKMQKELDALLPPGHNTTTPRAAARNKRRYLADNIVYGGGNTRAAATDSARQPGRR